MPELLMTLSRWSLELISPSADEDFVADDEIAARDRPSPQPSPRSGEREQEIHRRNFLELMGTSLAAAGVAGLGGCNRPPAEEIVPYVRAPEDLVVGVPRFFATSMPMGGYGVGLLVESHENRPTKVEGNPQHPASKPPTTSTSPSRFGPTDAFAQASILDLYDPDRSKAVTHLGEIRSWDAFVGALRQEFAGKEQTLRLRVLTETVTSPTLGRMLVDLTRHFPQARWHVDDPLDPVRARAGARYAFGQPVEVRYDLSAADVIVSLDADFLGAGRDQTRMMRDFSQRRVLHAGNRTMNRLYVIESSITVTGTRADHRQPIAPAKIESFAIALAEALGVEHGLTSHAPAHGVDPAWIRALAEDLKRRRGRTAILVGESQPPLVHALGLVLNNALGNIEGPATNGEAATHAVTIADPVAIAPPDPKSTLQDLADDLVDGKVDALFVLGGNPAYSAPADLDFAHRMGFAPFRVHFGLYADETAAQCQWHVNAAHFLESWGDLRAFDGSVSLQQPLIAPLYNGVSAYQILGLLNGEPEQSAYELIRAHWRRSKPDFDTWWRTTLHDGVDAASASPRKAAPIHDGWRRAPGYLLGNDGPDLQIAYRLDPTLLDGRFGNNAWLQELPKPITSLTWGNALHMSPNTAVERQLAPADRPERADGEVVEITYQGRTLTLPAIVIPGHPDGCVTLHLGHGRTRAGRVGTGIGADANKIRRSEAPTFDRGVTLRRLGRNTTLAVTQSHHKMEEVRKLVRTGTVTKLPEISEEFRVPRKSLSLYPEPVRTGEQWGMVIDLTLCTGCTTCIIACQSENNIPTVGYDEVTRGREMHWIRVASYWDGDPKKPETIETHAEPVACMHCETAPCEVVCPVGATVHSSDGLNDMVYNRCVGTRYCSNNCPYKVRRFNFFQFADFTTESLQPGRNPEVTVRSRGVMEKCTYCVQRIRKGQIAAQRDGREVADGDVVPACQSACPAGAIVFGNLRDPAASVAKLQDEPTHYGLLADIGTRPRTTYLASIRNPNPEIAAHAAPAEHGGRP
jgi:Fe-S-cluster-containing dehydrogenase component